MKRRMILAAAIPAFVFGWVLASGASPQTLSDADFRKTVTAPKTADDHLRLAAHYRSHAAEHEADAKLHDDLADRIRKARPQDDEAWDLARDSAHYAEHSREAAEALRDLAAAHAAVAERLRKK